MTNKIDIYGADSIALLAYFADKLGNEGNSIFGLVEERKASLLIPSIVIGEILFTIKKERSILGGNIPKEKIKYILDIIHQSPAFIIVDLNKIGWDHFLSSNIKGLHDRMIVSTCKQQDVEYLITRDSDIIQSTEINVIW